MKKVGSWGVNWSNDIFHASGYSCACNSWSFSAGSEKLKPKEALAVEGTEREENRGIRYAKLIVRCPSCSELFWFHISFDQALNWMDGCPNWPEEKQDEEPR